MSIVVLKFGGSSVGDETTYKDPGHLVKIASLIKKEKDRGNQVVVVVSAMAGETRRLKGFCQTLVPTSEPSMEDDVVMAAGEQVTAGLLAKLLGSPEFGLKAQSLMGWQIPVITDDSFNEARIKEIRTEVLQDLLNRDEIPVIAGFQGISESNRITTLGFDGSDTTAVAIAVSLKAEVCRFYKDVRGIYTANPRRVPKARKLEQISMEDMLILSTLGARILHPNSLKWAMNSTTKLHILPNFTDEEENGTYILNTTDRSDISGVTYFQLSDNTITLSVVGEAVSRSDSERVIKALNQKKIYAEMVTTEFDGTSVTTSIGWAEQLDTALQTLHSLYGIDQNESEQFPAYAGAGKQIYRDPAITTDQ